MTAVGRLVISRLLNFATGLERVYDPFLFPVLGTKESIKKGKTILAIQLAVYIYQKCRFIYLFVLYSKITDRFPEKGGNRYGSARDRETFPLNFNTILRFRVNYRETSLELSGDYEFPWKLHISFSANFTLISDETSKPVS